SLLYRAAWLGSPSAVLALLNAGADPNYRGAQGLRPLHFASELADKPGGIDAITTLIRKGADVNAKNDVDQTALAAAAANGSAPAIRLLLDHRADPLIYDQDGYGPLHYAFALMAHPDGASAVRALIQAGADVNAVGTDGVTPLLRAAFRGSPAAVQLLLDAGA
ncbi:hypothetical protein BOTBODRAFT_87449, partial [Botryobasidium botryosum FD-172 SS1]